MGVSKNSGIPKSSILIGFSIINHPFWGTPIFGNTHINLPKSHFRSFYQRKRPDDFQNERVSRWEMGSAQGVTISTGPSEKGAKRHDNLRYQELKLRFH